MKVSPRIAVSVLLSWGGLGCAPQIESGPPWANVPDNDGDAECAEPATALSTCDWMAFFDDLIVFEIAAREERASPAFYRGDEIDPRACSRVSAAVVLTGRTLASGRGANPGRVAITGNSGAIADDELTPGTRVLATIIDGTDEAVLLQPWLQVQEDRLVDAGDLRCFSSVEFIGQDVEQVLRDVGSCPATGTSLSSEARHVLNGGAVCLSLATPEPECTIDLDCDDGIRRCTDGLCVDR